MAEGISIRILICRFVFDLVLIGTKENGPPLDSGRCQCRQCRDWFTLTENMLKKFMIGKNSKTSNLKVLIEFLDTVYYG